MQYLSACLALALLGTTQAGPQQKRQTTIDDDDFDFYLFDICVPRNFDKTSSSSPCWGFSLVQAQCISGPQFNASRVFVGFGDADVNYPPQPFLAQRNCACQSQMYPLLDACWDCFEGHGGNASYYLADVESKDAIASYSTSYCAADATPTAGLMEEVPITVPLGIQIFRPASSSTDTSSGTTSTTSSNEPSTTASSKPPSTDPIGSTTAASYYYTPTVTGSAAEFPAQPTGKNGTVDFSSLNVISGQIRPTAVANVQENSPSISQADSTSTSTSTDGGAIETAAVKYGSVGLLVAAAIAMF